MANHAIRSAIQVETEPSIVSAYLRFLAVHTNEDSVQEQTGLVSDLAQVIVERSGLIAGADGTHSPPFACVP